MTRFVRLLLPALAGLALCAVPATAYDLPAVNLGFTSFLDGGPPAGPGHYLSEYVQYYTADRLNDDDGNKIPGVEGVNVSVAMTQYIYQSNQPLLLGGKWGVNVMLPLVAFDADVLPDNGTGLGDLLIGPYLQWDPIMGANGPRFMHRIELQTVLPTGDYDRNKALNQGSNHWSFNPYWSATAFFGPKVTASWRLHYLLNGKNDDPNNFSGATNSLKPGQAFHANFAADYEVLPKQLRIGVNGYYLDQFTDSERDGVKVKGWQEKVLAVGPGLVWHFSQDAHLFANGYIETEARNRPQGERYNLRFVYHF
ncbi:MAG: transporter [Desulfuromonadales bacterium]|nr:transporter [Desulfuromonadales bacterium]